MYDESRLQQMSISDLIDVLNEQIGQIASSSTDARNHLGDDDGDVIRSDLDDIDNVGSNISTVVEHIQKKLTKVTEELG